MGLRKSKHASVDKATEPGSVRKRRSKAVDKDVQRKEVKETPVDKASKSGSIKKGSKQADEGTNHSSSYTGIGEGVVISKGQRSSELSLDDKVTQPDSENQEAARDEDHFYRFFVDELVVDDIDEQQQPLHDIDEQQPLRSLPSLRKVVDDIDEQQQRHREEKGGFINKAQPFHPPSDSSSEEETSSDEEEVQPKTVVGRPIEEIGR